MARMQAIELEDYAWFPQTWRNCMTDFYHFQMNTFDLYRPAADLLADALRRSGQTRVVDLCSGGAGPLALVQQQLRVRHGLSVPVQLTDKYPNLPAFARAAAQAQALGGEITCSSESIDATAVPATLSGLRTLFSCFHHFPPALARRILQDSVDKQAPIAIFELSNRSLAAFLQVLLGGPLTMPLFTPFIKPFSWARLFWTYVIPVIPFCVVWDGTASNLRAYAPDEMQALIRQVPGQESYDWQTGTAKGGIAGVKVTYLIGVPRTA
ncbi:MAG: hypothetical protein KUL75_07260 [Sterolibacterium sp.]|nr:hypothetical protein [Sterolibacterium sp.]